MASRKKHSEADIILHDNKCSALNMSKSKSDVTILTHSSARFNVYHNVAAAIKLRKKGRAHVKCWIEESTRLKDMYSTLSSLQLCIDIIAPLEENEINLKCVELVQSCQSLRNAIKGTDVSEVEKSDQIRGRIAFLKSDIDNEISREEETIITLESSLSQIDIGYYETMNLYHYWITFNDKIVQFKDLAFMSAKIQAKHILDCQL